VKSRTTERFRSAFAKLPESAQHRARTAYQRFKEDPSHPSLRFKRVHPTLAVYSARVSLDYRAVGVMEDDEMIWFWIGSHADYDQLLAQL